METSNGRSRPYRKARAAPWRARQVSFIFSLLLLSALLTAAGARRGTVAGAPSVNPCAFRPAGPEFRVNTATDKQFKGAQVAMDADGDFVVVWGASASVYLRRFNAAGVAQGPEQRVGRSPHINPDPSVAMDADGDFVVAWESEDFVEGQRVHARRFNAEGEPLGDEFRVSTYPNLFETFSSVVMDADGDFVVTWVGGWETTGPILFARSYNAAGVPAGQESRINGMDYFVAGPVATGMGPTGVTVFTWVGMEPGGPFDRVYANQGGTFLVSTATGVTESTPSVAVDAAGNFVIAWASQAGPGSPARLSARLFNFGREARGPEFEVTADGRSPSVAMEAGGDFVVIWTRSSVGEPPGVYARRYDAAGVAQGPEFLVGNGWGSGRGGQDVATDAGGHYLVLSSGTGDVYARRYEQDCETPAGAVVQFTTDDFGVTEGCVPATLTVSVGRAADAPPAEVSVDYTITGGTASPRSDYTFAAGTLRPPAGTGRLTFAPGEETQEITLLVSEDGQAEGTETVKLTLLNPTGAVLGAPATATLSISDDETVDAQMNPVDDPATFVCQHYHDFLHRQPDADGLAFWSQQIAQCGADAACLAERRHNVSAAFFLSIEFQQTGYFVGRLYEACLGRRPSYEEFMLDVQRLGAGVEVGRGEWEERLAANKRAYAEEFVRRVDFLARYPETLTAAQYVEGMFEYAYVEPAPAEWEAAMDAFGAGGTEGRAAAMRAAMESASVFRSYYNRGFVLAEYFGYLRRDPNDAPDTDWAGYDFWLGKMDAFSLPGEDVTREPDALARVRRGEMVRAFIESLEYRGRFGRP